MATQVPKSCNPLRVTSRGLPGFAAPAYLKGAVLVSVTRHPVRSICEIPYLARNCNDIFCHNSRWKHLVRLGREPPYSGWGNFPVHVFGSKIWGPNQPFNLIERIFISFHQQMWRWQKTGRIYLAGEIALVTGLVMWITSLPQIRRKKFEFFYYTHHLYIIFLIFFLFHAGDRHFYMVFGGIFLFGLDKLLRFIQSRPETCILSARVFPSKAIELILPKHAGKASSPCKVNFMRNIYMTPQFFVIPIAGLKFTPTSVIFMKIPSISKFQWHSFSITSSSSVDDQTMSLIVKCDGEWTSSLYQMIHAELDSDADQMRCIPVAIEGPYGPATMDFLRCANIKTSEYLKHSCEIQYH